MTDAVLDWRLEQLDHRHRDPLLRFERVNRAWFARWIPDRGDDYFADFDARLSALLAEQQEGAGWFSVVVSSDGEILGRVNFSDVDAGSAWLGYRLAERVTGRGVASAAVGRALDVAAARLALRVVRARTSPGNLASQAVLERTGFRRRPAGTDERVDLVYERVLR